MRTGPSSPAGRPAWWIVVWGLFGVGVVGRLAPLFNQANRVFWQWPTEDGYLMMTIARHLAIGNGFATADGSIPTNGTQPGVTLVISGLFSLAGGDRFWGVWLTQLALTATSVVAALLLVRLVERCLGDHPQARPAAWLTSAVWFSGSLFMMHSMNCLETGPYALMVIAVALVFSESNEEGRTPWPLGKCLAVGLLLGLAFWIRNDAVFLILAACLTYVWSGYVAGGKELARNHFLRTLIFGSTSVAVAVPWLAFNQINFGHIMPVSGRAESLNAGFATNLHLVAPNFVENALAILPIPRAIETTTAFEVAAVLGVLLYAALVRRLWSPASDRARRVIVLAVIYIPCLMAFYGLFFGAGWFIPRYFYPFTPLLMVVWAVVTLAILERLPGPLPTLAVAALLPLALATNVLQYRRGDDHQHDQVVHWVEENVAEDEWVAAVQTGTLNFFHDRTLNLDGKVNIAAYEALSEGKGVEYLRDQTRVKYMVDWTDAVRDWVADPNMNGAFELVFTDDDANVGAARRVEDGAAGS
ncbi:MAG: hypothetical protein AAGH15_00645 [Myxococcota bacterium]